jgi:Tfp pilus assembly protein PilF
MALGAVWGYSRPIFGQVVPETPTTPEASATAVPEEIKEAAQQFALQNYPKATELLESARKHDPDMQPAHVLLFDWFARTNQTFLARMALERAVMSDPQDPEAYIIMGNIALQERRVTDAELQFLKAQQLLRSFDKSAKRKERMEPVAASGLANVAEAREKWADAQTQLEAVLKLKVNGYDVKKSDPPTPAELETLSKLKPDDKSFVAGTMRRLARAHFQQLKGDHIGKALKFLKDAKTTDPANVLTSDAALAIFYEQFGDHKNAKMWMESALQKAPNDLLTLLVAAQWAVETNQLPEAEKNATTALTLAEKAYREAPAAGIAQAEAQLLSARVLRGLIALHKKEFKTAEGYFQEAVILVPNNFAATNDLALALCEQKAADGTPDPDKLRKAQEYAKLNYQQKQRDPEANSTYGWVLYKSGYKGEAERLLRAAASLGNMLPDTAYYLAQVAYDNNSTKHEELKTLLKAALQTKLSFSMRPEAQKLLDKLNAEPPAKEKPADSKP